MKFVFFLSAFIIFWAMVGYPAFIKILPKFVKKKLVKNYNHVPNVTIMVVAHNEEKVIYDKLVNVCGIDYPREKLKILVSSDNSSDDTNLIVREYINNNKEFDIKLYETKERKGKTNAQNEAQKLVDTEYLVMTDANSMLKKNAVRELMASFISEDIAYVTGCLKYINSLDSLTATSESTYWDSEIAIRNIESDIQTITAGNGALYACRNSDYIDIDPIECHDSSFPLLFALEGKRALSNMEAIVYEKAGESDGDEFSRKVRMNRTILKSIMPNISILNIFKYKWFTIFYLGHRTCRYLLWISHLILYISSFILMKKSAFYLLAFIFQSIFYFICLFNLIVKSKNFIFRIVSYYCMTVFAQWVGVYNIVTGKSKPFWEKAESTR